ncbi:MAG: tetratricopeptide repeat protein [Candidatus Obscuribacterales bacterium]|nr:tetratricopeptide repeat protein [Candidatus Obscuribacterales bacterium]
MSYEPTHEDDRAKGVGELLKEAATAIKLRRYAEAEDFCVQALGVLDKASAVEHPSKAMALEFMGDALTGMEKLEDAGRFYKRAMDLSERIFSQENQVYISICYKLARTYESLSLLDECEPYFKLADELAKRHLSADHPLRETIAEGYAHLISRAKKRKEKVVEIMDSFRTTKERAPVPQLPSHAEEDELAEEESEEQKEPAAQERHSAPAYKGLREKSTLYENSAESMQILVTVIVLGALAYLVFLGYQQFSKSQKASSPPEAVGQSPAAALEIVKTYSSLDGKRQVKIAKGNRGVLVFAGKEIDAQIFQGTELWKASSAASVKEPLKLKFVESQGSLVSQDGSVLYAEDSADFKTRDAMQSVAKSLRNSYLLRGFFPQNADELAQAQVTYKNPVTGKLETPIIQVYRGEQGWNASNPEEKTTFETSFEAGNLWTNEPPFLPGSVHVFLMANPPSNETGAPASLPAVAIIKGADSHCAPIKLDKEKAFLIVLTPKNERTTVSTADYPMVPDGSQGAIVSIESGK